MVYKGYVYTEQRWKISIDIYSDLNFKFFSIFSTLLKCNFFLIFGRTTKSRSIKKYLGDIFTVQYES
jgi:hypothetical protein